MKKTRTTTVENSTLFEVAKDIDKGARMGELVKCYVVTYLEIIHWYIALVTYEWEG